MGAIRRLFFGLNPERLAREIAAADRGVQTSEGVAQALAGDVAKHEADLVALHHEIVRLTAATRLHPPVLEVQARLASVRTRLGLIRERNAAIDHELTALEQEVL